MELAEILQLIDRIDQSSLEYFEFNEGETQITLAKGMPQSAAKETVVLQDQVAQVPQTLAEPQAAPVDITDQEEGNCVTSPMVGVAYLQAGPGQAPYIQVGDKVEVGDTLLIIEAMKLMNEIQSDRSGIVTEILVDNEMIVEYGQELVRIK